jgi:hypothetical protein
VYACLHILRQGLQDTDKNPPTLVPRHMATHPEAAQCACQPGLPQASQFEANNLCTLVCKYGWCILHGRAMGCHGWLAGWLASCPPGRSCLGH